MLIENFEYLSPGARRRRERRAHEQDSPGCRNRLIRTGLLISMTLETETDLSIRRALFKTEVD